MTRALRVQTREIWQVTTVSLPAELEPSKTMLFFSFIFAPLLYDTRFKLSPLLQPRTLLCVRGHCLCLCVLRVRVCASVRGSCACVCWRLEELPLVRFFCVGIYT